MTKQGQIERDKLYYIQLLEQSEELMQSLNHKNEVFVSNVVKELLVGNTKDAQLFRQVLAEVVVDKLVATTELVNNELKRIERYEKYKGD